MNLATAGSSTDIASLKKKEGNQMSRKYDRDKMKMLWSATNELNGKSKKFLTWLPANR
jgi:hypothetical protein